MKTPLIISTMRLWVMVLIAFPIAGISCAVRAEAQSNSGRLPLRFVEAADERDLYPPIPPLVTIGSLLDQKDGLANFYQVWPKFFWAGEPPEMAHVRLDALAAGKLQLNPPTSKADTLVLLVGPVLDSGKEWMPMEISREKNTFTLIVEKWTDCWLRSKNIAHAPSYLLSLGTLPEGNYELNLEVREINNDGNGYQPNTIENGSIKFSVKDAPNSKVASLAASTLIEKKAPRAALASVRETMIFLTGQLAATRKDVNPGVENGCFDFYKWSHSVAVVEPRLEPFVSGKWVATRIVGPTLSDGEWMNLREIKWQNNTATLCVEVWTGNGLNRQNFQFFPVLIASLGHPKGDSVNIKVEWTVLRADTDNLYRSIEISDEYKRLSTETELSPKQPDSAPKP